MLTFIFVAYCKALATITLMRQLLKSNSPMIWTHPDPSISFAHLRKIIVYQRQMWAHGRYSSSKTSENRTIIFLKGKETFCCYFNLPVEPLA